ncbi:glycoside hydrolase [Achlya hypogyna]|uniref:glucan endo-1,3-beta-D-glucosidase n=1 Tax=Achlya hypogyna TaxID=1202772 RepID=A0A0A7CN37_ACHHY|nr:secreted protein [Achlya hypogyna]OQS00450.1 glycoside hydrolase [Achlya hypogyna]
MVRISNWLGGFCALVAIAAATSGVCYDTYNVSFVDAHFATIKERFGAVRTFQTLANGVNTIDAAAKAGLKIAAGVWIRSNYSADLQAAVDGARRHPEAVLGIFIGNEDLFHNVMSVANVSSAVTAAKTLLRQAGVGQIPVGSVQMDGDWARAPELAAACDIIGVNIYPFFGGAPVSWTHPVLDLDARFSALQKRYGDKVLLTETGWPHAGGNNGPHISSRLNAIAYYQAYERWVAKGHGGASSFYFMFHDNPAKGGFEANFGLAAPDGRWKFDAASPVGFAIRTSDGSVVAQANDALVVRSAADLAPGDLWSLNNDTLVNVGNAQCLDVSPAALNVALYPCTPGNANQRWRIDGGQLVHATHAVCLAVDPTHRNKVQVRACEPSAPHQQFNFK